MEQQVKVTNIWNEFKENVKKYVSNNSKTSEKEEAINYIKINNTKLLDEVDKAVKLYEENSVQNIVFIIQITIFIIGTTIMLITWIMVSKIINKSEIDLLTNIYNRKKFTQELEQEINRARRYDNQLGLIMFDIDHFKRVNDKYGHDVGDKVLIEMTDIVGKVTRSIDIFARWGGEEFMIIVHDTELNSTISLAERLRKEIMEYRFNEAGRVTCSFGVIQFQSDDDFNSFVKRVDDALYKAKEEGRNRVIGM
jgi:diguanylate cyclase (GGDEF)-like protein